MNGHTDYTATNTAPSSLGTRTPFPGTDNYDNLPQFPTKSPLPFRRTIRRHELHQIVPLAETTKWSNAASFHVDST